MAYPELRRLTPYLRPHRRALTVGAGILLLATPLQLFHPLVWMFVVDEVIIGERHHLLLPALGVMLAVHLTGAGLGCWRSWLLERAAERFVFALRNDCYDNIQRQPLAWFHARRSGDLQARVMNDVDALREVLVNGIDAAISNLFAFACVAGVLIWLHWVVGLVTLLPLLAVFVIVLVFNHQVKALYGRVRARLGDVGASLHERLIGMNVIKGFAREEHEIERFREATAAQMREGLRAAAVRALYFPSVRTVGFLSNIVMIGLGAFFVIHGSFSIGGLVAYRGYWWQLFSPVQTLAQIGEMLARAEAAAERVNTVLHEKPAISDASDAIELDSRARGELRLERLCFSYANGHRALHDIDLHLPVGGRLGVVGPSGAGKSTLLALLLRLYDPDEGRILLDGHDLRELSQRSLRQQFGVVAQEAFLFHDSVRANIRYGRLDASDAAIVEAARLADADDFIRALPQGYETIVGERGVTLSGGQRQRLCIARAFLADPAILLLDEATAAVEPESERAIQTALGRLMRERTTVLISHRLSMVRDCEQIIVIAGGELVERGDHEELMRHDGWYARMYRLQIGEEALQTVVAQPAQAQNPNEDRNP